MIGLYRGKSIPSRIVRIRTWSEYSHASWIRGNHSVIEAWWKGGVREKTHYSEDHTPGTLIHLFDIDLSHGEHQGLEEFFKAQLGKKYDWMGCLHFITRRPEYARDQDRWFCSELIFAAFEHIKKPLLLRIPAYKVSPGLLSYSPLLKFIGQVVIV